MSYPHQVQGLPPLPVRRPTSSRLPITAPIIATATAITFMNLAQQVDARHRNCSHQNQPCYRNSNGSFGSAMVVVGMVSGIIVGMCCLGALGAAIIKCSGKGHLWERD